MLSQNQVLLLSAGLLTLACATPESSREPFAPGASSGATNRVVDEQPLPELRGEGGSAGSDPVGPIAGGPTLFCGNGEIDDEETCDDGNARPGDGCSGICRIEGGYECVEPGEACTRTVICGDVQVGDGEACDDGNTGNGDGCSANCSSIERGWSCPPEGGACTLIEEGCGNGLIESGEECDDANTSASDGCSADCKVEPGYVCPVEGELCQTIQVCGDGLVSYTRNELCDDGNTADADGCSSLCRIEPGWVCTQDAPSVCTYDVVCGDKRVRGTETCDDGDTEPGDGCSETCELEAGWTCPNPGAACRPACGDGLVLGREECDDGNVDPGDGCSATCQEEPGWVCPPAEVCRLTVCGDGVEEGSESCDDGNAVPFDGCSSACMSEPICGTSTSPVGECSSVCGDGILLGVAGEECDDGNELAGDGCASDCTEEAGFSCQSLYENPPDSLTIPIIYRDFSDSHPDFGNFCCSTPTGMVESLLDADRKPIYAGTDAAPAPATSGKTAFDQWYRDVEGINFTFYETLALNRSAAGDYSMDSNVDEPWYSRCGFYPIETPRVDDPATTQDEAHYTTTIDNIERTCDYGDGWGFGHEWLNHNYLFTSELRYWFEYQGGEELRFSGDDDVWVFLNGQLAVDLGGVHPRSYATLVLGTDGHGQVCTGQNCVPGGDIDFGMVPGSIYEFVLFQAERWCCDSNYWLTLSSFVAGRSICEPVCGDGILTPDEACDYGTDPNGNSLNTGAYGGCTPECTLAPYCGDGITNGDEGCDDGSNIVPYDQSGVACAPGCQPSHFCGDGALDTLYGEVCDAGADNAAGAYGPGACTDTCQPGPYCGDGFKNGPEACDDGAENGTLGSSCDLGCQIKCGNGVVDGGEECDLGEGNNNGEYGGCTSTCTLGPRCGDGVQNGDEACDDGENDGSYGTCNPDCSLGPFCGDGSVDGPEQCDLAEENQVDPYGPGLCTVECNWAPYCGDGAVQPPEECDGEGSCNAECEWAPIL